MKPILPKLIFDRYLSKSIWKQLSLVLLVLVVIYVISCIILCCNEQFSAYCSNHGISKIVLPLYLLIDTNALNNLYIGSGNVDDVSIHGWTLLLCSLLFISGAFVFNGWIIATLTSFIERRVKNHGEGLIHYLKSNHYMIIGYDEIVSSIINSVFQSDENAYILVVTSERVYDVRQRLKESFSKRQMKRIIINYGHCVSHEVYKDTHLESAKEIFVVGDHSKLAHDAINFECMNSISNYLSDSMLKHRPRRITCAFKDFDTYSVLKSSNSFRELEKLGVEFVPYNVYAGWAKQVFIGRSYKSRNFSDNSDNQITYEYPSLYGNGIVGNDDRFVHLVFVGMTNFSVAFAMEAAHILHFPNGNKVKTRITFIDKNADVEKDEFIMRNSHLFEIQSYIYRDLSCGKNRTEDRRGEYVIFEGSSANFLDVEFEFIKGDVFSKSVQEEIKLLADGHNKQRYLSIFLVFANQKQNFLMGMNMPDEVYDNSVNIFIRQDCSDDFITNLRLTDLSANLRYCFVDESGSLVEQERHGRYSNMYPFGMNRTAFFTDEESLNCAKLCNFLYSEKSSTYQFLSLEELGRMSVDDIWRKSEQYWSELSVSDRWSNLYNAYSMVVKLETLRAMRGLALDDSSKDYDPLSDSEIEMLAVVEHNRWNIEKLLMGYRKTRNNEDKYEHNEYSSELSLNKRLFIHHDLRSYSELGDVVNLDREFAYYIPWLLEVSRKRVKV